LPADTDFKKHWQSQWHTFSTACHESLIFIHLPQQAKPPPRLGNSSMTPKQLLEQIEQAKRDGDTILDLSGKGLTELPPEIGQLDQLTSLLVYNNRLTSLPPQIVQLTSLTVLNVARNELTSLPASIGQLTLLTTLAVGNNPLTELPAEIGQLKWLQHLHVHECRLSVLPSEIGQLKELRIFQLQRNPLTALPPEIAQLESLTDLRFDYGGLTDPPPEIVKQGTEAILAYLREKLEDSRPLWESKLLVVGEGGVGKTQLLRALRGKQFQAGTESETTWGIDVLPMELPHPEPEHEDVTMTLRCWDFGGQNIYHATHQFFLTTRSMFLLAWNARLGWEQGKLHYWLDTIQALAPGSPVLLVATHVDERPGGLPLEDLIERYPQIMGEWSVSNSERDLNNNGIDRLRNDIALHAAKLPLMGQGWPGSYWDAMQAIRELKDGPDNFIHASRLRDVMREAKVAEESLPVLTEQLHQLGEILYFQKDELISDTVFLDPSWVTKRISEVLVHDGIVDGLGIFTKEHMQACWSDLELPLQNDLLRLMEHFDLSYEIPDDPEDRSLVVERLALDPAPYEEDWDSLSPESGCREIRMKFDPQSTRPAGIPGWFIARSHRFTTHTHWKYGALFQDDRKEGQRRHLALLHSSSQFEHVELSVRGPNPQSFFSVLRDGLELTFDRFPGLKLKRSIPCPACPVPVGKDDPAPYEFDWTHLEKRLARENPKLMIECPQCEADVSVTEMLFGLHWTTESAVLQRLDEIDDAAEERQTEADGAADRRHQELLGEFDDLRELSQRQFTYQFNRDQRLAESHCPRVFSLRPEERKTAVRPGAVFTWPKGVDKLLGTQWTLQLYCEEPGCWHPSPTGGEYTIDEPAKWASTLAPHVGRLVKVFKYAAPLVAPGLGWLTPEIAELLSADVKLMTALVGKLPDIKADADLKGESGLDASEKHFVEGGGSLRSLRQLLVQLAPDQHKTPNIWGGLTKTITPEGHWLWLCDEHRQPYVR
jgi:internalin A